MNPPELITQVQPMIECADQATAWVNEHSAFLGIATALAFVGFCCVASFTARIMVGLGNRAWARWGKRAA